MGAGVRLDVGVGVRSAGVGGGGSTMNHLHPHTFNPSCSYTCVRTNSIAGVLQLLFGQCIPFSHCASSIPFATVCLLHPAPPACMHAGACIIEANLSCPNVGKGQGALYTDQQQVHVHHGDMRC